MTVTQLRAFLAVVSRGSVTAAADELFVTQPSVSSAIAALGRELGCELFERSGRGIRLTAAGEAFAPYAADVIGLIETGSTAAREAAALSVHRLRIAAVTTAAESFVPPLMSAFAAAQPALELSLDVGNREYVFDRVLSHSSDIAVAGQPPEDGRLVVEPLLANEIVCVAAPDDPRVGGRPVAAASLLSTPWLLREPGSGTRAMVERFLAERELRPRTLTLGSNGAIKQAARAGLGVALLSRVTVSEDLSAGRLGEIPLSDPPPARTWFLVRSGVGPVRPAVQTFSSFVLGTRAAPAAGAFETRSGHSDLAHKAG
ncbi:MAG TPA: LysR family transcriptional regulator [Solirubrobacteraceae bacterium]|nr:LysR family transcriptional regulator [Solirubrobacteraceae bacterium]